MIWSGSRYSLSAGRADLQYYYLDHVWHHSFPPSEGKIRFMIWSGSRYSLSAGRADLQYYYLDHVWHHSFPPSEGEIKFRSNKPILNQIYENYETCYTKLLNPLNYLWTNYFGSTSIFIRDLINADWVFGPTYVNFGSVIFSPFLIFSKKVK